MRGGERRNRPLGRRGLVLFVLLVAGIAGWIAFRRGAHQAKPPADLGVRASIPRGAIVVAELDVAALRRHRLTRSLLAEPRAIEGIGDIAALCGADPLQAVDTLALALPADADAGFGVFAIGPIEAAPLARCAEAIIDKRGGKPVRERRDGFALVRDAAGAISGAELAVRDHGPLVLAERGYLALALRAAAGEGESALADPAHAELRAAIGDGVLVVTAVLTPEQRKTLSDELGRQGMRASPFAAIRSGALALRLDEALRVHGVLTCDDEPACRAIADVVRAALAAEAKGNFARVLGYAPILERITVAAEATRVDLRGDVPIEDALAVVRRVLALRQLASQPEHAASSAPAKQEEADPVER